jgi:hypothetical protein
MKNSAFGAPMLAAFCLLSAGCTHYVPTVTKANQCDPKDFQLSCAAPTTLQKGTTYGQLLDSYLVDREALRECANRLEGLAKFLARCNAEIDDFNRRLADDIAKGQAAK